uniref:Uncharacterized protein n=1 Tax=Heterorhabditis bacteriophora TaxID=37862 RepID=A0A1I7W8Q7_HETBA
MKFINIHDSLKLQRSWFRCR